VFLAPPQATTKPRLRSKKLPATTSRRFRGWAMKAIKTHRPAATVEPRSARRGAPIAAGAETSAAVLDVFVTVTAKAYEDDPFGGTVVGEIAHVVELGFAPQLRATAPLKPPIGVT